MFTDTFTEGTVKDFLVHYFKKLQSEKMIIFWFVDRNLKILLNAHNYHVRYRMLINKVLVLIFIFKYSNHL